MTRPLLAVALLLGSGAALAAPGWSGFEAAFPLFPCPDGWSACVVEETPVSPEMMADAGGNVMPADLRIGWFDLQPTTTFSPFGTLSAYPAAEPAEQAAVDVAPEPVVDPQAAAADQASQEASRQSEEAARQSEEASRAKQAADAEAARMAEERKAADAEAKRAAQERAAADAKMKAEAEAAKKAAAAAASASAAEKAKLEAAAKAAEAAAKKAQEAAAAKAAEQARLEAEQKAKAEAAKKAQEEAAKRAQEETARKQAEEAAKKAAAEAAAAKAKADADAKLKAEADAKAKADAEAKAKAEAEAKAKAAPGGDAVADAGTVAPADCADLQALEAPALLGKLSAGHITCLKNRVATDAKMTDKDKVSRLLMTDAWAKGDKQGWEKLAKYHLEEIGQDDPALCFKYATRLAAGGPSRAPGVIRWADVALENRTVWSGDEYVSKVYSLYKLKAVAAQSMWSAAEAAYTAEPTDALQKKVEDARNQTKTFAREWYEYAKASGKDKVPAQQLCMSAAGTADYCEGG